MTDAKQLVDTKIDVKLKLSALWVAVMFCYVYGDFFGLYQPGHIAQMLAGRMEPLGAVTQSMLLGVSAMMAIPATMIFFSVALPSALNRWINIIIGLAFTAIVALTMPGAWNFYLLLSVIEMLLTLAVVAYAWSWPRRTTG